MTNIVVYLCKYLSLKAVGYLDPRIACFSVELCFFLSVLGSLSFLLEESFHKLILLAVLGKLIRCVMRIANIHFSLIANRFTVFVRKQLVIYSVKT